MFVCARVRACVCLSVCACARVSVCLSVCACARVSVGLSVCACARVSSCYSTNARFSPMNEYGVVDLAANLFSPGKRQYLRIQIGFCQTTFNQCATVTALHKWALTKSIVLALCLLLSLHQVSHQSHSWGKLLIRT